MSVSALYKQVILDHNRAPRHFGSLTAPTHAAQGNNPLCGDHLHLELSVAKSVLQAIAFRGEACAIAIATASLMSETVMGRDLNSINQMHQQFQALLQSNPEGAEDPALVGLNALIELRRYPARIKCALLPWVTLKAALENQRDATTDEQRALNSVAPPDLQFRAAGIDDVDAVVALVESAYRGDSSRAGWTTEADFLGGQRTDSDAVTLLLSAPGNRILLCERTRELLACAHVEKQGEIGYFGMFAVRPTLQGAGVGRSVLAEAERIARVEWSCREMQMTVISIRTELVAWYERCGYRRTGVYKPFPYGDVRFGIPKRDDLRFEVLSKGLL